MDFALFPNSGSLQEKVLQTKQESLELRRLANMGFAKRL